MSLHHWPVFSNVSLGGPDHLDSFANKHSRNKIGLRVIRLGTWHSPYFAKLPSRDSSRESRNLLAALRDSSACDARVEPWDGWKQCCLCGSFRHSRASQRAINPCPIALCQPSRYAPSPPRRRPPLPALAQGRSVISPQSPSPVDLYRIKHYLPLMSIPCSWSRGVTGQPGETCPAPLDLPCLLYRLGQARATTLFC